MRDPVHIERSSSTTRFITHHLSTIIIIIIIKAPSVPTSVVTPRRAVALQHLHEPQRLTVQLGVSSTTSMPLSPPPPHQPTSASEERRRRSIASHRRDHRTSHRPARDVTALECTDHSGGTPTQRMTHVNNFFSPHSIIFFSFFV
ncbi:uncharacterized protein LOC143916718 [Arctopsyche grandis]|uniref:uncharacterized protein LOC143916718 n=1 Tax=Arctopsyche grandis TaxID=121162 RepID=UPI00406D6978